MWNMNQIMKTFQNLTSKKKIDQHLKAVCEVVFVPNTIKGGRIIHVPEKLKY